MQSINRRILKQLVLSSVLLIGIYVSLFLWDRIRLPFHNPWGVTGELTKLQFNPSNNMLRFAMLLLFPSLLLLILFLFKNKRLDSICFRGHPQETSLELPGHFKSRWNAVWVVLLITATVLVALSIPTLYYTGQFDSFHDGESLGPAISYLNGQTPYEDFVVVHGAIQDPLRSVLAFKLFGRSIGSSRAFESLIKALAYLLMALFILRICRGNYILTLFMLALLLGITYHFIGEAAFTFICKTIILGFVLFFIYLAAVRRDWKHLIATATSMLLLGLLLLGTYRFNLMPRDITTFAWLLTIPTLQDFAQGRRVSPARISLAAFFFSFLPFASLAYSTDRGSYLLLIYLILFPLVYILYFRKSDQHMRLLFFSGLGLAAAVLFFGLIVRGAFAQFFKFALLTFPRYVSLLNGLVLKKIYLTILVLPSLGTFWMTYTAIREFRTTEGRFRDRLDGFLQRHLIELSLWLVSVIYFLSVLQRADANHFEYTAVFSFIFLLYILMKYILGGCLQDILESPRLGRVLACFAIVSIVALLILSSCVILFNDQDFVRYGFPLGITDEELVPEDYQETVAFLKENMDDGDGFLTMTSEGSWYYLLDLPCPVRFSSIFLSSPVFFQEEVVEDLKNQDVKFVLYSNGSSANSLSDSNNEERLPIIMNYIDANYAYYCTIGSNVIWIRRDYLPPTERY